MSHKLNIARVRNCPSAIVVKAALDTWGRPVDKNFGVLDCCGNPDSNRVEFTIYRTKEAEVKQVERETGAVRTPQIRKDDIFRADLVCLPEGMGVLEVLDGSAKSIEVVGMFLTHILTEDKSPDVEFINLDIEAMLNLLRQDAEKFALLACKLRGYSDSEEESARGTFSVNLKGVEPNVAMNFMVDHSDKLATVKVKVQRDGLSNTATTTLRPSAYFTYACKESDEALAKDLLRKLAGVKQ